MHESDMVSNPALKGSFAALPRDKTMEVEDQESRLQNRDLTLTGEPVTLAERHEAEHPRAIDNEASLTVGMTKSLGNDGEKTHTEDNTTQCPSIDNAGAQVEIDTSAVPFGTLERVPGGQDIAGALTSENDLIRTPPTVDQDVIIVSDEVGPQIKEEFSSDNIIDPTRWPEHPVDLVDDMEITLVSKAAISPEVNEVPPSTTGTSTSEPIIIQENGVPFTMTDASGPKRLPLKQRKPMTLADQEKRAQLQQELMRRHLAANGISSTFGGPFPVEVRTDVQSPLLQWEWHSTHPGEQRMEDYSPLGQQVGQLPTDGLEPQNDEEYDPHREWQAAITEAKAAKASYQEAKQKYKSKKSAGQNTREDDINFLTLSTKEQIRQKRFKDTQAEVMEMLERALDAQESSDDDTLFVSNEKMDSSFSNNQLLLSDRPEVTRMSGNGEAPKQQRRRRRQTNKVSEEAINAGMENERMKEMRKATKGRSTGITKSSTKSSGRRTKTGRIGKSRAQPRSLFRDFNSLFTSNVYVDPKNKNGITLSTSTQKDKRKALNEIISSIPLEDRTTATRDKNDLLAASKTLGPRQCSRDPSGDWKLNGMKSLLHPFQVLAAASMKDREDGITQPAGGILGDEMGFGKTVTTIATIIANLPPRNNPCKTTLIVVPASLLWQWQDEIYKHAEPSRIGKFVVYHSSQKLGDYSSAINIYQEMDIILTTYGEIINSFPKFNPPQEFVTFTAKREWFKQHLEQRRGLLHRLNFYRIVLDEAQVIKNYLSQTSQAVRALEAKFRWAISGTPILNSVDELYPYFKFLRVKYSGSIEVFRRNFCERGSDICNARVQALLKSFMIRRTHNDTLMGQKLVILPENHVRTVHVDFMRVERAVYDVIRKRFVERINSYSKAGNIKLKYNNVLTMLLILRQLCSHLYLVQDTIQDIFLLEDFEKLWSLTAEEVATADRPKSRDMLAEMTTLFQMQDKPRGLQAEPPSFEEEATDQHLEASRPLVFRFRQNLRDLAASDNFTELRTRSVCAKCRDFPSEPFITSCYHLYCHECLRTMSYESSVRNEDHTECLACGSSYNSASPCPALQELGFDDTSSRVQDLSTQDGSQSALTVKRSPRWIEAGRSVTPSSKAAAVVAQIQEWLKADPACKIVVFTQFRLMIKVLARLCSERQWVHCVFHGGMSHQSRNNVIKEFRDKEEMHVMIASLKCGGVGLNLTMANRVICIDPWWNSPVEQQAFCRVYRIGQTQETYVTRIVIENTVDQKLLDMQDDKARIIKEAMGEDGKRVKKLSMKDLMRLFGTLSEDDDEDGPEFIIVEDEPNSTAHLDKEYGREQATYEDVMMLE